MPGCRNGFIDCQKPKVRIAVVPIMDSNTWWDSTLELLERAHQLRELTPRWLKNPQYSDYQPIYTTQDEWTIAKYVMEVVRPMRYWTLWLSKMHMVSLHHVITVYNAMFNHMDGVMQALANMKTQWKQDLYFTMKFAWHKLSISYGEVSPTTGVRLIPAGIIDLFRKLWSYRKWD